MPPRFPVDQAIAELRGALRSATAAVLQAPPGAGKTTRVPPALLDEPWLSGRRIVMLEPRRLAARAAARWMARQLGEDVGGTVGYRVRMDTRVGPRTRIEVVTEGVLTRMIQADPALDGVGLVIFDEFHERSLHADLGLALCLQSRALLRDDLRLLVMSATLEGIPVARLLGDAPLVTSEGRAFPVETRYLPRATEVAVAAAVEHAVRDALRDEAGDILVFLPGAGEIRQVADRLADPAPEGVVDVLPLFGNLPQDAQDRAIVPAAAGRRKVVLSTAIAETSLTIEGVRVVVDSGLMRVPRFSPRTGMTRLATVRITRSSADQRRGRAGRLGPGVCYRLWTEPDHAGLVPHGTPEILEADLAPLALELAAWGVAEPGELQWLDAPPASAFSQARELLGQLGALDAAGTITPHGRAMAGLAVHPRLAHMMLRGAEAGLGAAACDLVALLGERDIFRSDQGIPDADARLRLDALRQMRGGRAAKRGGGPRADPAAARRVADEARHWRRRLDVADDPYETGVAGALLALAYPDRVAQLRAGSTERFLLRNGRGAALPFPQALSGAEFLAVADLDGAGRESRIFLAAPLTASEVERLFLEQIEEAAEIAWDDDDGAVRASRALRLGALTLGEAPIRDPDPEAIIGALVDGIRRRGLDSLPWRIEALQLRQRLQFLHRHSPGWPDVSEALLLRDLDTWLGPHLFGIRRLADLQRLDLAAVLLTDLPWERRRLLDELAPTHLEVPSGSRISIDYADPDAPVLAVRLQEMFGLHETPRIANGAVPLTIHLLSPAHRPVQVTQDLGSFWKTAYFEVRKDLRGRYPKHFWPDDPLQATATRRARPR